MQSFKDIAKPASDLLGNDYSKKVSCKIKGIKAGCVGVTAETERKSKDGTLGSKITAKFAHNKFQIEKLQFKPDGSHAIETSTVVDKIPGLKLTFNGTDSQTGDLGAQYTTPTLALTGSVDIIEMGQASASAALGHGAMTFGGDAKYKLSGSKSAELASYNLGASYKSGSLFASAVTQAKLSALSVGLMYSVNDALKVATLSKHTKETPFAGLTAGGEYKAAFGVLKGKVTSDGVISQCYTRSLASKVSATVSGEVGVSELTDIGAWKYGLALTMG